MSCNMDSDNVFPFRRPEDDASESRERGIALTDKIYQAILPLLGPEQAQELIRMFRVRSSSDAKVSLYPIVDQLCDLCHSPMKLEEEGDPTHFITSCTKCGYMDVLKK